MMILPNINQHNASYNGITYVDIDQEIELPPDFETDRIPNKGDIMCFNHLIGNESINYHWEVLYIYDKRTCLTNPRLADCEHFSLSIFVVMKRIQPELGQKTWQSIYQLINPEDWRRIQLEKIIN